MRTFLQSCRDHLKDAYPWVEVGVKPADVPANAAYACLFATDVRPEGNTLTPGDIDLEQTHLLHIKTFGPTQAAAGLIAATLDRQIRDGLAVDGHAVQLVIRDRASGPTFDEQTHPAPEVVWYDRWYSIDTAPLPADVGS